MKQHEKKMWDAFEQKLKDEASAERQSPKQPPDKKGRLREKIETLSIYFCPMILKLTGLYYYSWWFVVIYMISPLFFFFRFGKYLEDKTQ